MEGGGGVYMGGREGGVLRGIHCCWCRRHRCCWRCHSCCCCCCRHCCRCYCRYWWCRWHLLLLLLLWLPLHHRCFAVIDSRSVWGREGGGPEGGSGGGEW